MEEFRAFASEFGKISSICPRSTHGLAFVTSDIRDAQNAVARAGGRILADQSRSLRVLFNRVRSINNVPIDR
jgi:hypothetical protein